jgi:hypothetical protein
MNGGLTVDARWQMEMHAVAPSVSKLSFFYITDNEQLKKYIQLTLLTVNKYTHSSYFI